MPVSEAMIEHLQSGITTLCVAVRIVEILPDGTDGDELSYVNHSQNLVIDGDTYTAIALPPTQVQQKEGLEPDNTQVSVVQSDDFSSQDLRAGRWQAARVIYQVINYADTSMGAAIRKVGYIGKTQIERFKATPEIRSLSQLLEQEIGEVLSEDCRVVSLGDERCQVDLDGETATGYLIKSSATVISVTSKQEFTVSYPEPLKDMETTAPDNHWSFGNAEWLTGNNQYQRIKILRNTGNSIVLYMPTNKTIVAGDTLLLIAGCDRRRSTCRDKFDNAINFQGEPDTPGRSRLFRFP